MAMSNNKCGWPRDDDVRRKAGRRLCRSKVKSRRSPAPRLWLNSPPLTPESLRGKVVVVDFWTYSCINCLRALPYVEAWYAEVQGSRAWS